MWSARLLYVVLLSFARFWGLPSLTWTIICLYFQVLGLYFLVFSRLRFHIWGRNPVFQKPDSCGERTLATRSKRQKGSELCSKMLGCAEPEFYFFVSTTLHANKNTSLVSSNLPPSTSFSSANDPHLCVLELSSCGLTTAKAEYHGHMFNSVALCGLVG